MRILGAGAIAVALFALSGASAPAMPAPSDFAAAAARIDPSCVGILTGETGRVRDRGAGFVWRPGGLVVTAAHVVAGSETVSVRLPDGRESPARILGRDELSDVALLRVAADLPPAATTPIAALRRGDPVAAVGDPLGFAATLTVGHVSTLARSYDETSPYDLLQHDAALNPGSSGGPLVDRDGRVVAMNVAIADGARRHVGIGLALPIDTIDTIAERLLRDGAVPRPRLGLRVRAAAALRPAIASLPEGVVVEAVDPGSAAAAAGLAPGDVVVAADGRPLAGPRELARAIEGRAVGGDLRLTLREADRDRDVVVALAAATAVAAASPPLEPVALGLDLGPGRSRLIAAVAPDTPAEAAGLAVGDEVIAVGDHRLERTGEAAADLLRAAERAAVPGGVALLVRRGDKTRWVVLGRRGRLDGEAPFGSNAEAISSHPF